MSLSVRPLWFLLMPSLLLAQPAPEPDATVAGSETAAMVQQEEGGDANAPAQPPAEPQPEPEPAGTADESGTAGAAAAAEPVAVEKPETSPAPESGTATPAEPAAEQPEPVNAAPAEETPAVPAETDAEGEQPATDSEQRPPASGSAPHRAENIDLKEVVAEPIVPTTAAPAPAEPQSPAEPAAPAAEAAPPAVDDGGPPLVLLENEVPPGTATRLAWSPKESFAGIAAPTPVLVVNGARPGPVLCLTAAIHGDELVGIEIVRRILYEIDPQQLSGALIGVPIVNLQGFHRSSRYLPDRRDLNRFFPGNPNASSAARIAHSFFNEVVLKCDALVDLHTGSFHRTNLPQVRADLGNADVAALSRGFGATVVLQSRGARGSLRRAAVEAGIPTVTLEAGEPLRLDEDAVAHGVKSVQSLLDSLGMLKTRSIWARKAEPVYYKSAWVRASQGGVLMSKVKLGERVRTGDLLGAVTDPITNARHEISSPYNGRVIGMALNQVMMPGFAAYHIGIQATPEEAAETDPDLDDGLDEEEEEEGVAPQQGKVPAAVEDSE